MESNKTTVILETLQESTQVRCSMPISRWCAAQILLNARRGVDAGVWTLSRPFLNSYGTPTILGGDVTILFCHIRAEE